MELRYRDILKNKCIHCIIQRQEDFTAKKVKLEVYQLLQGAIDKDNSIKARPLNYSKLFTVLGRADE